MSKAKVIRAGVWLQGKHGLRRVSHETDWGGFEYIEFFPDESTARRGFCSGSALRQWGKPISEQEALAIVPNIEAQSAKLKESERQSGGDLAAALLPAVLATSSDEALIAELQRRGCTVERPH